ncbi:AAA family ATPase [Agarilytica rhodophyticola]|uniref:AAA family ATPase n=1 Tax=Agarilytica rhodophyticola TaxID=1737490 RepID=UPI000B346060|nr:AAA family ATPase [Agarilytica rhodophyticola]
MTINNFLDFSSANDQIDPDEQEAQLSTHEVKSRLLDQLTYVLHYLFPEGKEKQKQFIVGDIDGNKGKSLVIELHGSKAGVWHDFATGESGDIFDLWAHHKGFDIRRDFSRVIESVSQWLGTVPTSPSPIPKRKKAPPMDDLGPVTAKWDYHDSEGNLIACVYRYDPPGGKEFRPWDVKARKQQAPKIRPLYQQPAIAINDTIIFVEGEKCADALSATGNIATTAMGGANTLVDKTDWSPLKGKHVMIWPDNDEPGRTYANNAARAIAAVGALSVSILDIPKDKPEKWDVADAIDDGVDVNGFIKNTPKITIDVPAPTRAYTVSEILADETPTPDDLIEPRVLTPGGMMVLGGAPKVGKSDFILSLLMHMAAGEPFIGLKPTKRLRIFYLQAEVQYYYLRDRIRSMNMKELMLWRASDNLFITPRLNLILNNEGYSTVKNLMRKASEKEPIDVIVIDPLRNVFDGGEEGAGENDNNTMMYFLKERVERLRDEINPNAGIVIVHHTKKIQKRQLIEDPFLSFSGASSLRSYYTTGALLYRPEENKAIRKLTFELRNGIGIKDKYIDKRNGKWVEIDPESERLINQKYGEKLDAERRRKGDQILQLLYDEALQGRAYTIAQFAEKFEGTEGLGGHRTIVERLNVHATKGDIKFFKDSDKYGLRKPIGSKFGYVCTEEMQLPKKVARDDAGKEVDDVLFRVKPTHYKCAQSGAVLPVENPDIWVRAENKSDEKTT